MIFLLFKISAFLRNGPRFDGRGPVHNGRGPLHNGRRPVHNDRVPLHNGRRPVHNDRRPLHNDRRPLHNGCSSFIILRISVSFINHTTSTESKFVFIKHTLIILLFSAIFFNGEIWDRAIFIFLVFGIVTRFSGRRLRFRNGRQSFLSICTNC